jgi:hypothetical protein
MACYWSSRAKAWCCQSQIGSGTSYSLEWRQQQQQRLSAGVIGVQTPALGTDGKQDVIHTQALAVWWLACLSREPAPTVFDILLLT